MSSLLNWKAQCGKKIQKQRDTHKRLKDEAESSRQTYVVPAGWIDILADKDCPEYYFGLHHKYLGIRLHPRRHAKIFGCRDIILSSVMARGRVAADASPSTIFAIAIIDLYCDVGGWKSSEVVQGHLYHLLRQGLKSIRAVFSIISADTVKTTITAELPINDVNSFFPNFDTIDELWSNFITGSNIDHQDHRQTDEIILILCILELQHSKNDIECSLLHLLMAIVKTGNVSSDYVDRRYESLVKLRTGTGLIFSDSDVDSVELIWKVINYHITNDNTTIDYILENILKITNVIENVVLKPMPTFLAYRGLTPIVNISTAISNFPTFPWRALIKTNSTIKAEFILLKNILQVCEDDVLLGYKISGAGTAIPNLSYLAVCLLIEAGGSETLKAYRGIGPQNKARVTSALYLDSLVEKFKVDLLSGQSNYEALKSSEEKLKDILARTGLTSLMASFLSASANSETSNKEIIRDSDFDYSSSDGDDDDPPPPKHKDSKRKRHDSSSPDGPPKPTSGSSSQRGAPRSEPREDRERRSPRKTYKPTMKERAPEKYQEDYDDQDGAGGSEEPMTILMSKPAQEPTLSDLNTIEAENGATIAEEDVLMETSHPLTVVKIECVRAQSIPKTAVPAYLRRSQRFMASGKGYTWTYPGNELRTCMNLVMSIGSEDNYSIVNGDSIFPVFIHMIQKMRLQKTDIGRQATSINLLKTWPINQNLLNFLLNSSDPEIWENLPVEIFHDGILMTSLIDANMLERLSHPGGFKRPEQASQPGSDRDGSPQN